MPDKQIKATKNSVAVDNSGVGNRPTFNINNASKYGSRLNSLLEKIIHNYDPDKDGAGQTDLPDPDIKIKFNDVQVYAENIYECISFLSVVEEQIDFFDDEAPGSKNIFLKAINQNYREHKNALLIKNKIDPNNTEDVIRVIRSNADQIIQSVCGTILNHAEKDLSDHFIEEIKDSIYLIVCFGFINCKILEKPNDYK